jgi:NADH:ubiquinone oxidoreductase subunit 5 (subunit L)/multisubunit Na+/H+ antiporter MnhA subunit
MSELFAFLIIGVGSTSFFFSKKYLQFHKERNKVLLLLASLLIACLLIAVADNVFWILNGWLAIALLLPSLIGFDGSRQSQQAKKYIRNHLLLGTILLGFGFMIILSYMDSYSLNELLCTLPNLPPIYPISCCIRED